MLSKKIGRFSMKVNETAEEYLGRIPMWAGKKNSLKDIRRFLQEMDEPDEKMKIFHVAGTNGKGSVCAFLQSVLLSAGYRVGTFTSPHLTDIRERFFINGEMVSEWAFEESFRAVRNISERMKEKGYFPPTYFEFLFYMAMDIFAKAGTDFVILETGMGGRLDTTNVIRHPLVSVITSISLDHTEYLGDTVEKIAAEKAGIIKKRVPVVFDGNDRKAAGVIEKKAKGFEVPFYKADRQEYEITGYSEKGYEVKFSGINGDVQEVLIPSPAEYQVMNGLLAFLALEAAGLYAPKAVYAPKAADDSKAAGGSEKEPHITSAQLQNGFSAMRWPARMEEVFPGVFLDGAHNPGGIESFARTASELCAVRKKRACLFFSAVSDKAHKQMIETIVQALPLDYVAVAHINSKRGLEAELLLREFQDIGRRLGKCVPAEAFPTSEEAVLRLLHKRDEEHLLFCVGSLYLMGEIKTILRRDDI